MGLFKVPIFKDAENYTQTVSLDLTKVIMNIRYNSRNDCWYMTLKDSNDNVIADGIPMLTSVIGMFQTYRKMPSTMAGDFVLFDNKEGREDCTRDNVSEIVKLYYANSVSVEVVNEYVSRLWNSMYVRCCSWL